MFPKSRAIRWVLGVTLAIGLAYYAVYSAPLPFVERWWSGGDVAWEDPFKRRHRMVDWVLLSNRLIGLPRAQVVALLGEPPATGYFRSWDMVYPLGRERGFLAIDSEWLVLRLDQGVVVEAANVRD